MHKPTLPLLFLGVFATACGDQERPEDHTAALPADALKAGWAVRYDDPEEAPAPVADPKPDVQPRFLRHDDGLEVTPGPNCSLWHDDFEARGDFRLTLDVTHLESGLHPHGAGLTFGGTDVQGKAQRYTYFLVRGDRHFLIKTRNGEDTADVVNWTEHEAVAPEDKDFMTRNVLVVERSGEQLRFLVNDKPVHECSTAGLPVEGRFGVRLVHDLKVRFRGPTLEAR